MNQYNKDKSDNDNLYTNKLNKDKSNVNESDQNKPLYKNFFNFIVNLYSKLNDDFDSDDEQNQFDNYNKINEKLKKD